jgi:CBS domain-containing protein
VTAVYGFVSDILADKGTGVFIVSPGVPVREAVRVMNAHGVGALVVMERGRLAGIFTERDVLKRVVDRGLDPETTLVREVMTGDVVTVGPAMPVTDAMSLMTSRRVRHLPVLDDAGEIRGLVSIGDLMRRVTLSQAQEIDQMVDYITGRVVT